MGAYEQGTSFALFGAAPGQMHGSIRLERECLASSVLILFFIFISSLSDFLHA
jgi:hypothetical protein